MPCSNIKKLTPLILPLKHLVDAKWGTGEYVVNGSLVLT